jgi:hypothetical protein
MVVRAMIVHGSACYDCAVVVHAMIVRREDQTKEGIALEACHSSALSLPIETEGLCFGRFCSFNFDGVADFKLNKNRRSSSECFAYLNALGLVWNGTREL